MSDQHVAAVEAEEPKVLDTYSVVYSLILAFLLPNMVLLTRLPFGDDRSLIYSFEYVSLVAMPFVLGLALTFLLDSDEGPKRALVRFAILTPLIVLTGVTFMFGFSLVMLPASKFLGIADQGLSVAWWAGFLVVTAPLFLTLARRVRRIRGAKDVVQVAAILVAVALIIGLAAFSFLVDANIYDVVRKDVVIYVVGALSWYLPSFGLAAGIWRSSGLV